MPQNFPIFLVDLLRSRLLRRTPSAHSPTSKSPSQPVRVVADDNIIRWGTFLNFCAFFVPQAQHSKAQRNQPAQEAKASTRRSERDNASKQTELARASMSSSIYTARCVLRNERRNRNLPGLRKYTFTKEQLSWCDVACTLLFLSALSTSSMQCHAASGLFPWILGLLAFIRKSPLSISDHGPLCLSTFMHSHFVQLFLGSERSGRPKPHAERSALYLVSDWHAIQQHATTAINSLLFWLCTVRGLL